MLYDQLGDARIQIAGRLNLFNQPLQKESDTNKTRSRKLVAVSSTQLSSFILLQRYTYAENKKWERIKQTMGQHVHKIGLGGHNQEYKTQVQHKQQLKMAGP